MKTLTKKRPRTSQKVDYHSISNQIFEVNFADVAKKYFFHMLFPLKREKASVLNPEGKF